MNSSISKLLYILKNSHQLLNKPIITSQYKWTSKYQGKFWPCLYQDQKSNFSHTVENYVKLKSQDLQVNPGFGALHANGTIDFIIKPTNPQEYPDCDRAFVNIYGLPSVLCEDIIIELMGDQHNILTISATPKSSQLLCHVMLPIKYDVDVRLVEKAGVQVSGMEADEVKLSTEEGEIKTKDLKSHNISINTKDGYITSEGFMQGNIFINAKKTHLRAKRLQGLVLDIEAEELSMAVESSYVNQGQISAQRGDIRINNLHGCTDLLLKEGTLVLNGFHGQISGFVGRGKVEAQVTDVTGHSTLHLKEGQMALSILDNPRHGLEVSAPVIEVTEDVKSLGTISTPSPHPTSTPTFNVNQNDPEVSLLKASVKNGSAWVSCQDWFSTLGIKSGGDN